MAMFVAVLGVAIILISIPLVFLKPQWVFYLFITCITFTSIFYGYIVAVGNLGMPRTWTPADFLVWLTLFASFFCKGEQRQSSGLMHKTIIVLAIVCGISLITGFIRHPYLAFTFSRTTYLVAAMIFAFRYLTTYSRVENFFKFSALLLVAMFAIHICIRFAIYTPPTVEEQYVTELGGERGGTTLVPMLYLALMGIAMARLVTKQGKSLLSAILLIIAIAGIVLTETRSTYGAAGVMVVASLLFAPGKVKNFIFLGLAALAVIFIAARTGFDFFERFKGEYEGEYAITLEEGSWRTMEYGMVVNSYRDEPYLLLTGRGVGAWHLSPQRIDPYVSYYHSEYLGWLDRCGIIGLVSILILMIATLRRSWIMMRTDNRQLQFIGTTCFLVMIASAAEGIFHPIFSHQRGAALLICFVSIMANWELLFHGIYEKVSSDYIEQYPQENTFGTTAILRGA